MNRSDKADIVERLSERLAGAPAVYVADFTGLKVKDMTELRRQLRSSGMEFVVVKNTLALRALQAAAISELSADVVGPTGLVFAEDDPLAAAKILHDFHREYEGPAVRAGLVEGRRVGPREVKQLAALPSRDQLLSQLGGVLQAPLQGFAGVVNGLFNTMLGALEALRVQRGNAA